MKARVKQMLGLAAAAGFVALLLAASVPAFTTQVLASQAAGIEEPRVEAQDGLTPVAYVPYAPNEYVYSYVYAEDFQDPGRAPLWTWGTNSSFDYGYKTDPDKSKVYHIRVKKYSARTFVTGPVPSLKNLDYGAWVRRATENGDIKEWYDEYGILISPNVINPQSPSGDSVYTFHIRLRVDNAYDSYLAVAKWSNLATGSRTVLYQQTERTYMTDANRIWNRLRIVRSGNTLTFYVTTQEGKGWKPWKQVYAISDPSLPDQLYIGFYGKHSPDNDRGSYEIEFQYDNLYMSTRR